MMATFVKYAVKALLTAMLALLSLSASSAQMRQIDSTTLKALGDKLDEYVQRIGTLGIAAQEDECDFLISACSDSLTRQFTALKLYSRYINSGIMGVEAVAIHLTDKWFIPGKIKMKNYLDLMNARIYADFNRSSLVGMKAPELALKSSDGTPVTLFAGSNRRRSILYFYDTGCANCLAQSVLLRTMLNNCGFDVELDAVYTGADSTAWRDYAEKRLTLTGGNIPERNLWDPSVESDFQRKYGVLQTPRMFLIDRDGTIMGRGLDVPALTAMLEQAEADDRYDFGNQESAAVYDRIFAALGEDCTTEDIKNLADRIADRTSGDRRAFRETIGDLMYYLSFKDGGRYKEAEKHVCDKYILARPDIWNGPYDSLKVTGFAKTLSDILSRAEPGSTVDDIRVRGAAGSHRHFPENLLSSPKLRTYRFRNLPAKEMYVMFYDDGCSRCQEYMVSAGKLLEKDASARILFVPMSGNSSKVQERLLDAFDLTTLPLVMKIAKGGKVIDRYVDFR